VVGKSFKNPLAQKKKKKKKKRLRFGSTGLAHLKKNHYNKPENNKFTTGKNKISIY
jgi:hypothetical protein